MLDSTWDEVSGSSEVPPATKVVEGIIVARDVLTGHTDVAAGDGLPM